MKLVYDFTTLAAKAAYGGSLNGPAREGDVGIDLRAVKVTPAEIMGDLSFVAVWTGVKFKFPDGYYGEVVPRSSMTRTFGVSMPNSIGIIDSGYRGEISVLLKIEVSTVPVDEIVQNIIGRRFVQLVLHQAVFPVPSRGLVLADTERAQAGNGSSGHD